MNLKNLLFAAMLTAAAFPCAAQHSTADEIAKAAMKTYDAIIAQDPKDYQTLFRRGNELYKRNEYTKALDDVNGAIKYAPASDKDLLFQAYSLRAGIYDRFKEYPLAIADLKKAIVLQPNSYSTIYQLGNMEFSAGKYPEAKATFKKLQSLNPRSQEALFGLARVAVKENDIAAATRYCDQAVDITPTQSAVYMRRASVYQMMGNDTEAVKDYTVALTLDRNNTSRALNALADMSRTNYGAVMQGLASAIASHPRSGTFYYIRAMIAKAHFHYLPAISDFNYILEHNLFSFTSLYTDLADCYYNTGNYATALEKADYAIGSSKDNAEGYYLKSLIKSAMDVPTSAIENADKAIIKNKDFSDAYIARGNAECALKFYSEASVSYGTAVTLEPNNPSFLMDRAYLLTTHLNQVGNARAIYEQVAALPYDADQVISLKGFALMALGRTDEADAWMNHLLTEVKDSDGEINYYGACFYAQRGDKAKALECMERSLQAGYASYHNWTRAIDGGVNVAPLRDDAAFQSLLSRYSTLFR